LQARGQVSGTRGKRKCWKVGVGLVGVGGGGGVRARDRERRGQYKKGSGRVRRAE